ncbi:MAG: DUF4450 domain-containing protein [Breznakibacter sp.]
MKRILFVVICLFCGVSLFPQPKGYWQGKERSLRYHPLGEDFVIVNGDRKFNRALYGTNTAFRVETGDVPEFGFFMPNMGGNMQLGLILGSKSLWLNDAEYVKSIYRPGSRIYEIKDPIIGQGSLRITVLAMADAEGMVLKVAPQGLPSGMQLLSLFGGASDKRFFRNGDLGVDGPNAFDLHPDACLNNDYQLSGSQFELSYAQKSKSGTRQTVGLFPENSVLKLASPYHVITPGQLWLSAAESDKPVVVALTPLFSDVHVVVRVADGVQLSCDELQRCFDKAEARRQEIASTVKINTPDPYFNTLGATLAVAADGIWDDKSGWQHGAVGWRMPLNGWRAAYVGDAIGWHGRARQHFDGYAASQITGVEATIPHPSQDAALNMARAEKKWGTQMYSNGYITRNPNETQKMHHYDMNLVFIDELLWHFNWTGDMDYVRKMWPVIKSHLAWQKRNFDPNGDGLYDAYACIWASDALQYNSGAVTYSSAYNYRANKMAALIATKLGEDSGPYEKEAERILDAINSELWLGNKGWWAEFKDFMGNKMIHPQAGLWTVYHSIDSEIHTPFQAYQATRYVDEHIPHIPVRARGLDGDYQTLSTTNWMPYSWSVNNVAFAEVAHASLAYWQAGRKDKAFNLFKSCILDGMYLGGSPGNIGQISFYDAARGECYRDFGDPIGVYSRALVQGLFGILPDAMNNRLVIRPGFPTDWNYASISTPDVGFDFTRNGNMDQYNIQSRFTKALALELVVDARRDNIASVKVNGEVVPWSLEPGVGVPNIRINCKMADHYKVEIQWIGNPLSEVKAAKSSVKGKSWSLSSAASIQKVFDPQGVLGHTKCRPDKLTATVVGELGHRTVFVQLKQGKMVWWHPVSLEVEEAFAVDYDSELDVLAFSIRNNEKESVEVQLVVNSSFRQSIQLGAGERSLVITVPAASAKLGTNRLELFEKGRLVQSMDVINWNLKNLGDTYEVVDMDKVFNATVDQIFKNRYLTPRSPYTTLQIPTQGIGEWCHPNLMAEIDDSGFRRKVENNLFATPFGVPFRTTAETGKDNIAFTTLWDNYPESITVPVSGRASHAYFLMAGSTNHMQSHVVNGQLIVTYTDGGHTQLDLVNPETWAPIEQDYYMDGYAFASKQPRPYRVALKSGVVSRNLGDELKIKTTEVYGRTIDGGAAIILDLPLDPTKELKEVTVVTRANEVVVGLMGLTLVR